VVQSSFLGVVCCGVYVRVCVCVGLCCVRYTMLAAPLQAQCVRTQAAITTIGLGALFIVRVPLIVQILAAI